MNATDYYKERASDQKCRDEFCELVDTYCTFLKTEPGYYWYIPKVNPHFGIIDYVSLSDIKIYTNVKFGENCVLIPADDKGNLAFNCNWEHSVHVDYRNKDKIIMCLKQLNLSYRKALEDYKIEKIEKDFK